MTFIEEQIKVVIDYVQRPLIAFFLFFIFIYQIGEKIEYAQTVKTYIIIVFLEIKNRFVTP